MLKKKEQLVRECVDGTKRTKERIQVYLYKTDGRTRERNEYRCVWVLVVRRCTDVAYELSHIKKIIYVCKKMQPKKKPKHFFFI